MKDDLDTRQAGSAAPPTPMTLSLPWRLGAVVMLAGAALSLTGCSSPPKDETASQNAERLYREAREDMDGGNYERAIKSLQRVEGLGAGSLLSQQAQLDLAYLFWRTDERAQAQATIDRFIKLNPSSPALDYAMYLRGLINFNDNLGLLGSLANQDIAERDQRASRDAFVAFRQLLDRFPESPYAQDARLRLQFIVNALATHEVHVARYYFRRGAYVAAANRAQQAVAEFQQAPALEEALYIMMESYEKLALKELRDGAERVLRTNFPDSRYLGGSGRQAAADRPWWKLW